MPTISIIYEGWKVGHFPLTLSLKTTHRIDETIKY